LEAIKDAVPGGIGIQWKTHSLQQGDDDQRMWEQQAHPKPGIAALAASKGAQKQGDRAFRAFHLATFVAQHKEHRDISDRAVLGDIAREAGLDVARFDADLDKRETWEAVGRDHMESREKYGVFGVPTIVFPRGDALFVRLRHLPVSLDEQVALFQYVKSMAVERPYLLELKRP
jgi:predicted DsbA family dithiol-disulfide isomerase